MRVLLLTLLLSLVASPVSAGEPDFVWEDDGTLRATVLFEASFEAVMKLLADPVRSIGLSPDVKSVTATPKGECHEVVAPPPASATPSAIRRCAASPPTASRTT